jgi:hypothetical protein
MNFSCHQGGEGGGCGVLSNFLNCLKYFFWVNFLSTAVNEKNNMTDRLQEKRD